MDPTFKLPTDAEYYAFLRASEKKPRRFELQQDLDDPFTVRHNSILFTGSFTDSEWARLVKMIENDADLLHAVAAHLTRSIDPRQDSRAVRQPRPHSIGY